MVARRPTLDDLVQTHVMCEADTQSLNKSLNLFFHT